MSNDSLVLVIMTGFYLFLGMIMLFSLARFLFYRQWTKESYVFVGGNNKLRYECVFVENYVWHHEVKISGLIVTLPKPVPHILLDLRKDDKEGDIRITPKSGTQQLSLEGDFNSIYDSFTSDDSQIDAREILTPELMEVICRHDKVENIEFYKDKLTIITNKKVRNNADVQLILNSLAEDITKELHHKFKTYNNDKKYKPLQFITAGTIKVGRRYISPVYLAFDVFSISVCLPLAILGLSMLLDSFLAGVGLFIGAVLMAYVCSKMFRAIYAYTMRH